MTIIPPTTAHRSMSDLAASSSTGAPERAAVTTPDGRVEGCVAIHRLAIDRPDPSEATGLEFITRDQATDLHPRHGQHSDCFGGTELVHTRHGAGTRYTSNIFRSWGIR
jgi:hypothetical protein